VENKKEWGGGGVGVLGTRKSKDIGTGFIEYERIVQQLHMTKGRPFFFSLKLA